MPIPSPAPAPAPSPCGATVTNVKFDDIRSVHVHSTWCNGAGDNRIVVVSERDDIQAPEDGTDWDSNARYKEKVFTIDPENATELSWVVYEGNAENVTVYNLMAATKYYFYFFEYDVINDEKIYMQDFTVSSIVTGASEPKTTVQVTVTDGLTSLKLENADVTFTNRSENIISKGRTNEHGMYSATQLPTGGVYVSVTAPGYDGVSLRSVYVKNTQDNKSSYKSSSVIRYEVRLVQKQTI